MSITIAKRLLPFTHIPGTPVMVPGSAWQVTVYPTLLQFENLDHFETFEYFLDVIGPVLDFTAQMDLEKGRIYVFGHGQKGYFHLSIRASEKGIELYFKKEKKSVVLPCNTLLKKISQERLSLGSHKSLEWDLVQKRRSLVDIFPVWFKLGQMTPPAPVVKKGCAELLQEHPKMEIKGAFTKLFMGGFHGILCPRLQDKDHLGLNFSSEPKSSSPLSLLSEGALLIRRLFFKEGDREEEGALEELFFLPSLSPEFHSGRFINIQTSLGDHIDMEWSKKLLKRVIIRPGKSRHLFVRLQKELSSFRVKNSLRGKGQRVFVKDPLELVEGKIYYLDRFEK